MALNAMLGTLQLRSGNTDAGIRHLRVANRLVLPMPSLRPTWPMLSFRQGDIAAALEVADRGNRPRRSDACSCSAFAAFIAQSAEDFPAAVAAYERVVAAAPDDWESWNNLGNARRQAGDFEAAVAALERAAELNPAIATGPVQLCDGAWKRRPDLQEAEKQLRRMADDFPARCKAAVGTACLPEGAGPGRRCARSDRGSGRARPHERRAASCARQPPFEHAAAAMRPRRLIVR